MDIFRPTNSHFNMACMTPFNWHDNQEDILTVKFHDSKECTKTTKFQSNKGDNTRITSNPNDDNAHSLSGQKTLSCKQCHRKLRVR